MASLTIDARTVLARLELLQHGTTTNYNPAKGSRNAADPVMPPGELDPPHARWRLVMEAASDDALPELVRRAQGELSAALRRPLAPVRTTDLAELKSRVWAASGFEASEVAIALRCTERLVRAARVEAGQHPETGRVVAITTTDPVAHAAELVAGGLTYRQAGAVIGVAHTTVSRWLASPNGA